MCLKSYIMSKINGLCFVLSTYSHLDVQGNILSALRNGLCLLGSNKIAWCKVDLCLRVVIFIMNKIMIYKLLALYLYVQLVPITNIINS